MAQVLYLSASPRGARSYSAAVAEAFLKEYAAAHPGDTIARLDVFERSLPSFDGLALQAKYAILHGQKHSAEERRAWSAVEAVISEFKAAQKYVFAVPMWNFALPYRLKQYLDVVVQPGYTFSFSPTEGYKGLLTGRPAFVAYARGGEYSGPGGEAMDFQTRYMDLILGFMGIGPVTSAVVEPTLAGGPDVSAKKQAAAIERARAAARTF